MLAERPHFQVCDCNILKKSTLIYFTQILNVKMMISPIFIAILHAHKSAVVESPNFSRSLECTKFPLKSRDTDCFAWLSVADANSQ